MALKFNTDPIREDEVEELAKPQVAFVKDPVPEGTYEMTIFAIRAKNSNAGNTYAEVTFKHTGEFKRFPFVTLRLIRNNIGKRQLRDLATAIGQEVVGLDWAADEEIVDQYGRMQAEFTRGEEVVSPMFIGQLVTLRLGIEEWNGSLRNKVLGIVVPKSEPLSE